MTVTDYVYSPRIVSARRFITGNLFTFETGDNVFEGAILMMSPSYLPDFPIEGTVLHMVDTDEFPNSPAVSEMVMAGVESGIEMVFHSRGTW